ncbi:MAG: ParB/RepB/Spo0J family partition protein [Weeksellaceae bacterium]|nr:ParB/RepB/Spo0J family partition protein [Weeksellaceae bacterium]
MAKEKKRVLGRGLSALLTDATHEINSAQDTGAKEVLGNIIELDINKVIPNPTQPRTHFDPKALEELAQSIRTLGVIQPITVRKVGQNFELISGERRYRASQFVGLTHIPAYVRLADDAEMLEMALVENIQREDLDAIEIALTYQRLIDEINLTQEQMSNRIGKDRSTVTNYLRLLKLDPLVQTGIRDGIISMGHGRALVGAADLDEQINVYEQIIAKNLSVRQTEQLIQARKNPAKANPADKSTPLSNEMKKIQKELSEQWDTRVEIKRSANGKGKMMISFNSDADFQRIKDLLN